MKKLHAVVAHLSVLTFAASCGVESPYDAAVAAGASELALMKPVCLRPGASYTWEVRPRSGFQDPMYPVYLPDHVLNTNPDFDDAHFQKMAATLEAGAEMKKFTHTFWKKGVYMFTDVLQQDEVLKIEVGFSCLTVPRRTSIIPPATLPPT